MPPARLGAGFGAGVAASALAFLGFVVVIGRKGARGRTYAASRGETP